MIEEPIGDPLGLERVSFSVRRVEVEPGVRLRVLEWRPEHEDRPPLVFVAGWVSAIEDWVDLLRDLAPRRRVFYLESREKRTAEIVGRPLGPADFTIGRLARDLVAAATELGLEDGSATFAGSSLGATAIVEALKDGRLPARGAFLVSPNTEFRFPWWGHLVVHLPAASYRAIVHLVLWYLRRFRVDGAREPEQVRRYERTLLSADPLRMKLSASAVRSYAVWPGIERVRAPVAVAWAPTDTLHDERSIERLVAALPAGRAVRCPTNLYMHRAEIAADIAAFEAELPGG